MLGFTISVLCEIDRLSIIFFHIAHSYPLSSAFSSRRSCLIISPWNRSTCSDVRVERSDWKTTRKATDFRLSATPSPAYTSNGVLRTTSEWRLIMPWIRAAGNVHVHDESEVSVRLRESARTHVGLLTAGGHRQQRVQAHLEHGGGMRVQVEGLQDSGPYLSNNAQVHASGRHAGRPAGLHDRFFNRLVGRFDAELAERVLQRALGIEESHVSLVGGPRRGEPGTGDYADQHLDLVGQVALLGLGPGNVHPTNLERYGCRLPARSGGCMTGC